MLVIRVRCPHCGYEFPTTTVKRVRCFNCLRTFRVYYKERIKGKWEVKHRVVRIEKGTEKELIRKVMKEVYRKN